MSDGPLLWLFLLQFIFIFLNAVFACSEIAVIAINDNKLERLSSQGDKRALRLSKLTENSSTFLATIQIGITLVNLLSSAVATENFSSRLVDLLSAIGVDIPLPVLSVISLTVITLLLTFFTVLLGELVPKQLALKNPEKVALGMSGLVYGISKAFTPIVWLLSASSNGILKLLGMDTQDEDSSNTEEEIRMMLDIGAQKGNILPEEENMIHNIFEFDDTSVEDIMTHRTEVTFLWVEDSEDEWEEIMRNGQHSIYPVCSETPDNVVGILYTKDYFRENTTNREVLMQDVTRPAYFVLESVRADVLFQNMKKSRNHFAVVIDEFGGTSGIITMNDLLEQIVGDFNDDVLMSEDSAEIKPLNRRSWRVNGETSLSKISSRIGVELPSDRFETLNDFFYGTYEGTVDEGSTVQLEQYGLFIKNIRVANGKLESAVLFLMEDNKHKSGEGNSK